MSPTTSPATSAGPLVRMRDIDFSYGPLQVLFGVDLDIHQGEILGLLGTNGAGKSTVLRVLAGLAPPSRGSVTLAGVELAGMPAEKVAGRGLVMVPGGRAMFPDLSVLENLEIGCYLLARALRAERIEAELKRFPRLAERARNSAGSLSGGEQQQLAIAKALVLRPDVLCVDELSLGLSPVVVHGLMDTVAAVREAGTTVVVVEQSLDIAARLCDRAVFLEKGSVRFEGHPRELLERGDLARSVFLGADVATPGKRRRTSSKAG